MLIYPEDFAVMPGTQDGDFVVCYREMRMFFYKFEFKDKTIMQATNIIHNRILNMLDRNKMETSAKLLTGQMASLIQEPDVKSYLGV